MIDTDQYRVRPGARVELSNFDPADSGGLKRSDVRKEIGTLGKRLDQLQELMYAEGKHSVLVVLQAMDAGGKDSTIRSVFGVLNPQGCRVANFRAPSTLELSHDYLWRIHQQVPPRGYIGVFNRSHYEDVLIVRVKDFVPPERWKRRYEHINAFEKLLADEGVTIRKFYLHISKDYQKKRLQRRLEKPDKHWKFNPEDLKERDRWDDYRYAFEDALSKCSTAYAPWYVIPAENRWYRNLLISRIMVDTLDSLNMRYPAIEFDPATIVIE